MSKNYYLLNTTSEKNIGPVPFNSIIEDFFEGEQGSIGPSGQRGLRGDRGMRGSEGPAGPAGPIGDGLNEADMASRTLWCRNDNDCTTPKNIIAKFPDNAKIQIGPDNKSLVLGGKKRDTGDPTIYTKNNHLFLDGGNAYSNTQKPGHTYINLENKGKTFINQEGSDTLLNDKKGNVGINMNSAEPKNKLHIRGDQPLTIENVGSTGTAGIIYKASSELQEGGQNWTVGANDLGFYMYDNNIQKYNLVAKEGSVGIGTDKPNKNFSLDIDGHGRFRQDFRMSGGPGASIQLNFNKNVGERDIPWKNLDLPDDAPKEDPWITYKPNGDVENCEISQGLEFIGGDNSRSKINFFGNEMDIQYGPLNKVLINFDRNGVNFVGPVKFKDIVTFEGPVDKEIGSNKPNYSFRVLEDTLFEGNNFHKGTSFWGTKEDGSLNERWTKIESDRIQTNNGVELFDPKNNQKSSIITYSGEEEISTGTEIYGQDIATGGIVINDNLFVKGSSTGQTAGLQTKFIKSEYLDSDIIRTTGAIQYSDRKIKEKIKEINPNENLEKINKMKGYKYFNKLTKEDDIGLIAQEIENIDNILVDNKGRYKGIKYNNIIPMLIEAVKHQQKEINKLKNINN